MPSANFEYGLTQPERSIAAYVDYFWMVANHTDYDKQITILPDGRTDILFSYSPTEPFHILHLGLENEASKTTFPSGSIIFGISFKLLAIEYVLQTTISINSIHPLPADFWGFHQNDLDNFDSFCNKASEKIKKLLPGNTDNRKTELFNLIYASGGSIPVKELSEKVFWSSRQINRYFNKQFGLSLKSYCNILRFRASFLQLKQGKLFPEENYTDQAHFIKEIKKFSGVLPKELSKNKDDRFIQITTIAKN